MKALFDLFLAGLAFLKALVSRRDPVKSFSANGHSLLEGWDHAPEEELIRKAMNASRKAEHPARVALYGYAGPSKGELIALHGHLLTLGTEIGNEVVLTPSKPGPAGPYTLDLSGGFTLTAPQGHRVWVNGREEDRARLYDYDRVELCGNKFLVMEMGR